MIIVKLQGGIGNQFFQYAAGRSLSMELGVPLYFDTTYYWYVRNRRFVLDQFHTKGVVFTAMTAPIYFPVTLPVIGETYRKIYENLIPTAPYYCKEKDFFLFSEFAIENKRPVYLDGFWQHPGYFIDHIDDIRTELQLKRSLREDVAELQKEMQRKNSVSIHVRRGDYTKLQSFGTCSLAYYHRAHEYISSHLKDAKYFVFSDDMKWARENLRVLPSMTFVEGVGDEVDDLVLQSSCTHHIIANSTFSWWAALLAPAKKGITIAPSPWLNEGRASDHGFYQRSWIVLDRDE